MMPSRLITAAAILFAAAVSVYGEPPKARWAKSWSSAVVESKERNVPIVLFMFKDDDAPSDDMRSAVLQHLEFTNVSKGWVNVYANEQKAHGTVKVGEAEMCKHFPAMLCQEHILNWGLATKNFFKATFTAPGVLWCDAEGKELGRHEGAWSKKELFDTMKAVIKKQGPGMAGDDYDVSLAQMAEGDAFAKDLKTLPRALSAYQSVAKKLDKDPGAKKVYERAKKGYEALEGRVRALIEKCREHRAAGALPQAAEGLKPLARDYRGHTVGAEAAKELKEVEEEIAKKGGGKK